MRSRAAGAAFLALAALLCGGCGASDPPSGRPATTPAASTTGDPDRPSGDSCAAEVKAMTLPTAFPRSVPLPPGFVVAGSETRSGSRQVLSGVRPGGFRDTLQFMQREYPAAGFALSAGEVEESDAESDFAGNGLRGRWAIRELPHCNGDTTVEIVVAPA